jgi:hypothetical protein
MGHSCRECDDIGLQGARAAIRPRFRFVGRFGRDGGLCEGLCGTGDGMEIEGETGWRLE